MTIKELIIALAILFFISIFTFVTIDSDMHGEAYCQDRGLGSYTDIFPITTPRCEIINNGEKHTYILSSEERSEAARYSRKDNYTNKGGTQ